MEDNISPGKKAGGWITPPLKFPKYKTHQSLHLHFSLWSVCSQNPQQPGTSAFTQNTTYNTVWSKPNQRKSHYLCKQQPGQNKQNFVESREKSTQTLLCISSSCSCLGRRKYSREERWLQISNPTQSSGLLNFRTAHAQPKGCCYQIPVGKAAEEHSPRTAQCSQHLTADITLTHNCSYLMQSFWYLLVKIEWRLDAQIFWIYVLLKGTPWKTKKMGEKTWGRQRRNWCSILSLKRWLHTPFQ